MRSTLPLLLLALTALAGCGPQIHESDDVRIAARGGLERLILGEYWEAKGFPRDQTPVEKVAIASFRVELVAERLTAPDTYGMSQFRAIYGDAADVIPAQLYEILVARFTDNGREVVPSDRVAAAKSYAQYPRRRGPDLVRFDRPIPSAAGKIRLVQLRTVEALALVEGDPEAVAAADAALAEELGVDAVLHVTVRVGVWEGRATVEEGTAVLMNLTEGPARLLGRRPLASHSSVLRSRQYTANISGEYLVDAEKFSTAVSEVFPPYIALAAEALRK